jgi:hypothetical protein
MASEPLLRHRKLAYGVPPSQALDEFDLTDAGRHDVGHDVRLVHRLCNRLGCMAQPQHAVAATVVDHRALETDDPWPRGACRNIGVHSILGVETRQSFLRPGNLVGLGQCEKIRVRTFQFNKVRVGPFDGQSQSPVFGEEFLDDGVGETTGLGGTAVNSHLLQSGEMGFRAVRGNGLWHRDYL